MPDARAGSGVAGSRRVRIGVFTQYYPMGEVAISRTISEHLTDRGHPVLALTTDEEWRNFRAAGRSDAEKGPALKWLPTYTDRSSSGTKRVVNYLSYSIASTLASGALRDADVNYVYATQPTAALAADFLKYWRGVPFVMHVQDVWPESVTESGMVGQGTFSHIVRRLLMPWVNYIYGRADAVIAISPEMAELLNGRGVRKERLHSIYNWAHDEGLPGEASPPNPLVEKEDGRVDVVYAGNMGPLQDLKTLLKAFALAPAATNLHLWMVGDGIEEPTLKELARELDLRNVTFTGRVDQGEMPSVLAAADFLLVTLKDLTIFRANVPSKFQAALAAGKPVITTVLGAVGRIVERERLGFVAPPENPEALAGALSAAAATTRNEREHMGFRARAFYYEKMRREDALAEIERVLLGVAKKPRQKGRQTGA